MAASGVTMSNVDPRRTVDGEIINAHAGGIYRFGGTYYLIGEHYQTCPHSGGSRVVDPLAVGNCEMCGHVNTTFAVYCSGDMEHWTLNTTDVIPDRPGGAAASLYTPVLAYNPAMRYYVLMFQSSGGCSDGQLQVASPWGPFTQQRRGTYLIYRFTSASV